MADALAGSPDEQRQRDAWMAFLTVHGPWELFATFTFKRDVHPESADKHFHSWLGRLADLQRGAGAAIAELRWFRAMEYQRRGVLHFHVLLGNLGALRYRELHAAWDAKGSDVKGYAWIERPRGQRAVQAYVTKYLLKGGELDLGGPGLTRSPAHMQVSSSAAVHQRERAYRKLARVRHALGAEAFEHLRHAAIAGELDGMPSGVLDRARAAAEPQTTLRLDTPARPPGLNRHAGGMGTWAERWRPAVADVAQPGDASPSSQLTTERPLAATKVCELGARFRDRVPSPLNHSARDEEAS